MEELIKNYFKKYTLIQQKQINKFFEEFPNAKTFVENILKNEPNWCNYLNIINGIIKNIPLKTCKICGKTIKISHNKNQKYCSLQCANKDQEKINKANIKYEQTCLKKYGVKNPAQCREIKNKIKNTCKQKYGVENLAQCTEIKNKIKNTCKQKYGVENPQQNKIIQEKTKQTCLKKYNFSNPALLSSWNNILSWSKYIIPMFKQSEFQGYTKDISYKWKCALCGNIFEQKIHSTFHKPEIDECLPRCIKCFPYLGGKSNAEDELITFCKQYFPNLKPHEYMLIKPYSLDIYIKELNLAIEFNGCYWHDIEHKQKGFHLMKTEMCEKLGVRLIHIWEDDWLNNKETIKQNLINIFENNEIIDLNKKLSRDWFTAKEIPGYKLLIYPPEIIKRNKYFCENSGYFLYQKL